MGKKYFLKTIINRGEVGTASGSRGGELEEEGKGPGQSGFAPWPPLESGQASGGQARGPVARLRLGSPEPGEQAVVTVTEPGTWETG